MVKFTLEFIPENIVLKDFIEKTRERTKTNPFIMSIERIKEGNYCFDITPIYPKIYWLGVVLFIVFFLLFFITEPGLFLKITYSIGLFISFILIMSLFYWTKFPYLWAVKKGLKKVDYSGSIKEVLKSDK